MRILHSISRHVMQVETVLGAAFGAAVMGFILLNVVTRSLGNALFWVDEVAITCMVWMTFLGASVAIYHRESIAVTLFNDTLPAHPAALLNKFVDVVVFLFGIAMGVMAWLWFDPLTLALHGFDTKSFASDTFNFIYSQNTNTIGIRKFWLWLILPVFSVNITLHALANLLQPIARPVHHTDIIEPI